MNFLGHALLSFQRPALLAGNMVADHVKGNAWQLLSPPVQEGIRLHRQIDGFTDAHPATRRAAKLLYPLAGRYGSAFTDLVYDHFLACDPRFFPVAGVLDVFAREVYRHLEDFRPQLPPTFLSVLEGMHRHHFLYRYREMEGMKKAFDGLSARASYLPANPYPLFCEHYADLRTCFRECWTDTELFARQWVMEHSGGEPIIFTPDS